MTYHTQNHYFQESEVVQFCRIFYPDFMFGKLLPENTNHLYGSNLRKENIKKAYIMIRQVKTLNEYCQSTSFINNISQNCESDNFCSILFPDLINVYSEDVIVFTDTIGNEFQSLIEKLNRKDSKNQLSLSHFAHRIRYFCSKLLGKTQNFMDNLSSSYNTDSYQLKNFVEYTNYSVKCIYDHGLEIAYRLLLQEEDIRKEIISRIQKLSDQELEVFLPKVERAFLETKSELACHVGNPSAPLDPPLPKLSNDALAEVKRRCESWDIDKSAYRGRVFEWVQEKLGEFIPGLTQGHLIVSKTNKKLYNVFTKAVERNGLPEGLDIPSDWDAALRNQPDAARQRELITARQFGKDYSRMVRRLQACDRQ